MTDSLKTKEALLQELRDVKNRLEEVEALYEENRRAAEKLRSFEKAFETMQLGITITNLEGDILYINPADLQMHGYSQDDFTQGNIKMFSPAETRKQLSPDQLAAMKRWKRESENRRKDGSTFPVQLMSDVIRDADGQAMGIVTTCEDITERKHLESEIAERIEELEKFYEVTIHREARMRELKNEIRVLKNRLLPSDGEDACL
jgi:PAS domain S-box-containing protein